MFGEFGTCLLGCVFANATSMRPFEPRKEILVQKYFFLCANVWHQENNFVTLFMGGEFTRTYLYAKRREKMTHDCLRGYVFLYMNSRGWEQGFVGTVTVLDLHSQTSEKESFPVLFGHS